jgi:hypothetical protein
MSFQRTASITLGSAVHLSDQRPATMAAADGFIDSASVPVLYNAQSGQGVVWQVPLYRTNQFCAVTAVPRDSQCDCVKHTQRAEHAMRLL